MKAHTYATLGNMHTLQTNMICLFPGEVFVQYFAELKKAVHPDDIAAELFAKNVITEN